MARLPNLAPNRRGIGLKGDNRPLNVKRPDPPPPPPPPPDWARRRDSEGK